MWRPRYTPFEAFVAARRVHLDSDARWPGARRCRCSLPRRVAHIRPSRRRGSARIRRGDRASMPSAADWRSWRPFRDLLPASP